jgi:membrane protease YdiL (CAAX protease family)
MYSLDKNSFHELILILSVSVVMIILYLFISGFIASQKRITTNHTNENTNLFRVIHQRLLGLIFLGVVPAFSGLFIQGRTFDYYGVNVGNPLISIFWILILSLIIFSMNLVFSRKPENIRVYPQIRKREWDGTLVIGNAASWIAYLFGYEFLFRGFLLFTCVSILGVFPAIIINTIFYSCAHIPKGLRETLAAIPFGIILCLVTIQTGNLWVAFFTHVVLALSNDFIAIDANPEFHYKLKAN